MTRILPFVFLLLMGMTWNRVNSTCVFETDFGLSINCGLKKSGMFRVRNLGGLKGYVGLGIQLADELGFKESLSTLEQNSKRRSVNSFPVPGSFEPLAIPQINNQITSSINSNNQDRSAYAKMNGRTPKPAVSVPPFRPLMTAANNMVRNVRLAAQQQQQQQQQQAQQQPLLKPLPVPAFAALPESIAKVQVETPRPPVAVVTPTISRLAAVPVQMVQQPQMPQTALVALHQPVFVSSSPAFVQQQQQQVQQLHQQQQLQQQLQQQQKSQQQQQMSPVYYHNAMQQAANRRFNAFTQTSQNSIEARPIIVMPVAATDNRNKQAAADGSPLSNEVDPASMTSLFNVAAANNVSVEQLAQALRHQQQRLRAPQSGAPAIFVTAPVTSTSTAGTTASTTTTTITSTTTTTTPPPPPPPEEPVPKRIAIKPHKYGGGQKVMNAPAEYYPVGYDKNFDDHFASKVDLPDTSFSCGDQKHFPGLYGDEDLGCMVFHVCAFTDEGLTQKSFLCPESTLFDQTILKCNWWFYVDCKSSRKLYDSNIPISKSYQLMKALTFFSSYSAGPTVDQSVAAATAAVSSHSDYAQVSGASNNVAVAATPTTTTSSATAAASTAEVLDNVSFRR